MLRPVPSRPPGPVEPADAQHHLIAELPALDELAAAAFALVALAGRSRADTAAEAGVSEEEIAHALARARKALRRAAWPLPGSGWCERAERLVSDRFDGALDERGSRVLEVHLENCSRCVEHERRLAQAQDGLVARYVERHPVAPLAVAEVLEVEPEEPEYPEPEPAAPEVPEPGPEVPETEPEPQVPVPVLRVVDAPVVREPDPAVQTPTAAGEEELGSAEPVAVELPTKTAAVEDVDSARSVLSGAGLAWGALVLFAVLLTIGSIVIAVAGALGAGI